MKTVNILFIAVMIVLTGCVTAGKYDELELKYKGVLKDFQSEQETRKSLEMKLAERNRTIEELNKEIESLNLSREVMSKEIASLEEQIKSMKSSSSAEIQSLIDKLEKSKQELSAREALIKDIESKLRERESALERLMAKLETSLLGFKDSGLSLAVKDGRIYVTLANQLIFGLGSTNIDKNGKNALKSLADVLNEQADINIVVEGHTDVAKVKGNPRFKDNWDLSVLRATEVTRYLVEDGGVDPSRIISSGRGEYFPVTEGDTPEIRAQNRRTEIILTPKLDELFQILKKK